MKTIELTKMNGRKANISIKAAEYGTGQSIISVSTDAFKIQNAEIVTSSDLKFYSDALKTSAALVAGRIQGDERYLTFVRLDEVNYAKLKKAVAEAEAEAVSYERSDRLAAGSY